MALVTSMLSGPMMQWFLGQKKGRSLGTYLAARAFFNPLYAHHRYEAITMLAQGVSTAASLDPEAVIAAVQYREQLMPTGVGHGVAVPHAHVEGVTTPVVAVGLSRAGIDFDAVDGLPAHLIFLLLTPLNDEGIQLDIITEITQLFENDHMREQALEVNSYTLDPQVFLS